MDVAAHGVLDRSVPDIAISSFDFQDPYVLMDKKDAMGNRLAYCKSAGASSAFARLRLVTSRICMTIASRRGLVARKPIASHGWSR